MKTFAIVKLFLAWNFLCTSCFQHKITHVAVQLKEIKTFYCFSICLMMIWWILRFVWWLTSPVLLSYLWGVKWGFIAKIPYFLHSIFLFVEQEICDEMEKLLSDGISYEKKNHFRMQMWCSYSIEKIHIFTSMKMFLLPKKTFSMSFMKTSPIWWKLKIFIFREFHALMEL